MTKKKTYGVEGIFIEKDMYEKVIITILDENTILEGNGEKLYRWLEDGPADKSIIADELYVD